MDRFRESLQRKAASDQILHCLRPRSIKRGEITDRVLKRISSGVDRSQNTLVLQHQIAHDRVGVKADRAVLTGYPGEDEQSVGSQHRQNIEGELRRARRFVHDIDIPHVRGHLLDRTILRRDVFRTDGFHNVRRFIRLAAPGIDGDQEALVPQSHCAQQSHRARAQDNRPQCAAPRQPLLNLERLNQALLGDRERFHQHRHIPYRRRDRIHIARIVDNQLREKAVHLFDAAFTVVAGVAEVLPPRPARQTLRMIAGTPHHRNRQIARLEIVHLRPDFDNLPQTLVPHHQKIGARRGRKPVLKRSDLAVGAADPDIQDAKFDRGGTFHLRRGKIVQYFKRFPVWEDSGCFHAILRNIALAGEPSAPISFSGRQSSSYSPGSTPRRFNPSMIQIPAPSKAS